MKYNPAIHHRRSIRLKGYDYTQPGAYFVTICTYHRDEIFGKIINGEMNLSPLGEIVCAEWMRSAELRKEIRIFDDEFIIMPNHLHGIGWIVGADGVRPEKDGVRPEKDGVLPENPTLPIKERAQALRPNVQGQDAGREEQDAGREDQDARRASLRRDPRSLGSFIAGFKASVSSRAGRELNMTGIWQRNYYEHIVRNDRELNNIRWYIRNNPLNWHLDRDNAQNIRKLQPPEKVEEYVNDMEAMVFKLREG
jgi:putative transposase